MIEMGLVFPFLEMGEEGENCFYFLSFFLDDSRQRNDNASSCLPILQRGQAPKPIEEIMCSSMICSLTRLANCC